jgi:tRNA(Ile)-lysidine synthase
VSRLPDRVQSFIREHHLLDPKQACLVAVSGGLDSMVLLHLLHNLARSSGWKLTLAHFNHRLRGRSSDADQRLVRDTARRLGLPFVTAAADVQQFARTSGLSLEMAGRKLRHEFLARAASRLRISKIAFAHHADDQLELFFLRLLRGSGGTGLSGMKPRNPSPVDARIELIRPLVAEPKAQLAEYAAALKITFREDATNSSLDIQRNRIRHELLPLLRRRYQPALERSILRVAELLRAESEFATDSAHQWLVRPIRGRKPFDQLPVAVQRRALQLQLLGLGIAPDFESVEKLRNHPETSVSLAKPEPFQKPGRPPRRSATSQTAEPKPVLERMASCQVIRDTKGGLRLRTLPNSDFSAVEQSLQLTGGQGETLFSGVKLQWEIQPTRGAKLSARRCTEAFDADQVGSAVVLRHWRPGDRFQPIGMKKTVKLQDLFTNEKVNRQKRHELIIAQTVQGEVFWVEGLRIAERFKLTNRTIRRLKWRWLRP